MGKRSISAVNSNGNDDEIVHKRTDKTSELVNLDSSHTGTSPPPSSSATVAISKSSSTSTLGSLSNYSGDINNIDSEEYDQEHPLRMHLNVALTIQKWGAATAIAPCEFLTKLLSKRGYNSKNISALNSQYRRIPTEKQICDYDVDLVNAIRTSDLDGLKKMRASGKCMSACNQYSESIVHMACRRSDYNIVEYLLQCGGDVQIVDDFGRTPLHDACWRPEPRFDIVTLLLDKNASLLQLTDSRGSTPLNYVREADWLQWCAYIFYQKERYWGIQ